MLLNRNVQLGVKATYAEFVFDLFKQLQLVMRIIWKGQARVLTFVFPR